MHICTLRGCTHRQITLTKKSPNLLLILFYQHYTRTKASPISQHRHQCNGRLWLEPLYSKSYLTLLLPIAL